MDAECAYCGEELDREADAMRRYDHHLCGPECRGKFKREGETVACDWCGESIYRSRSELRRSETNFCGKKCHGKYRLSQTLPKYQLDGGDAYPRWHFPENDDVHSLAVHRLAVIADGADPHEVFDSGTNVHHRNGCPLDNRPQNLEVVDVAEHGRRDGGGHIKQFSWMDILHVVKYFLDPQSDTTP